MSSAESSPQALEARRQAQLLAAIWQLPAGSTATADSSSTKWLAPPGVTAPLSPYTGHAQAASQQVLQGAYPSIERMIGSQAMGVLAWRLWQSHPPELADLNRWGAALPELIQASEELAAWPHLADGARLDWAVHECLQALDAAPELATLSRLGDTAPDALTIRLLPSVRVVSSPWPIVTLRQLHAQAGPALDNLATAELVKQALHHPQAETAVVWREGWEARVEALPAAMRAWMMALTEVATDAAASLPDLQALLAVQGDDFDVTAWLKLALEHGWLWRIELKNPSA